MPISRNAAAIAAIAPRERTTRLGCILVSIKDQGPDDVGRYAGWGTGEDLTAAPGKPQPWRAGMLPFPLRLRTADRWWKVGIGLFWIPAIVVVITVENWLGFPDWLIWTSLGLLYAGFMAYLLFWDKRRQDSIARR